MHQIIPEDWHQQNRTASVGFKWIFEEFTKKNTNLPWPASSGKRFHTWYFQDWTANPQLLKGKYSARSNSLSYLSFPAFSLATLLLINSFPWEVKGVQKNGNCLEGPQTTIFPNYQKTRSGKIFNHSSIPKRRILRGHWPTGPLPMVNTKTYSWPKTLNSKEVERRGYKWLLRSLLFSVCLGQLEFQLFFTI